MAPKHIKGNHSQLSQTNPPKFRSCTTLIPEKPTCHLFWLGGGISRVAQRSRSSWGFFQNQISIISGFLKLRSMKILEFSQDDKLPRCLGDPKHILPNVGAKWWWIPWVRIRKKSPKKQTKAKKCQLGRRFFHPNWKIWVKLGHFPKVRGKQRKGSKRSSRLPEQEFVEGLFGASDVA